MTAPNEVIEAVIDRRNRHQSQAIRLRERIAESERILELDKQELTDNEMKAEACEAWLKNNE